MPPPGYEPFLRAICADPEDDTVRLAYADWLDENGDHERAEFIRLQVAVPDRPKAHDPRYARAEELWKKNREAWFGELPELRGIDWWQRFRRGFAYAVVTSTGKRFIEHREHIFNSAPIDHLTLVGAGQGTLDKVFTVPELNRLTSLALRPCRIGPGFFGVVAQSPSFTRLRSLSFSRRPGLQPGQALTDGEARELVGSPYFPRLEIVASDGWVSEDAERLLLTRFKLVRFRGERPQARLPGNPPP